MGRLFALLVGLFLLAFWSGSAAASGDFGCTPSWKLAHRDRTECDNIAILGPGNDTRVNLVMLLADRHADAPVHPDPGAMPEEALFEWGTLRDQLSPVAPDAASDTYSYGEGSRCRSDAHGSAAYLHAVLTTDRVPKDEQTILGATRENLRPDCGGQSVGADGIREIGLRVKSKDGRAFLAYLEGASAFYDGDFDAATEHFQSLRSTKNPWLRETSLYMLARVEVNRAQVGAFDEYGFLLGPDHVDQQVIDVAAAALNAYIHTYPKGLYTTSARGLLRRAYWLGGRLEALASEYAATIALDPSVRGLGDAELAQEIDSKLLSQLTFTTTRDPTLLAAFDLLHMRSCDARTSECGSILTHEQLEAQRGAFAADHRLFDYLCAALAFYREDRPEEVLRLIPEETAEGRLSYLSFSRQMLRRMALDRVGRLGSDGWRALLAHATLPYQRPALELAIAQSWERSGMLARVFDANSPVRIATLRETLLTSVADAPLLRARATDQMGPAHERDVALFTLLYKELSHGAYADFVEDLKLVPENATRDGWFNLVGSETVPLGLFTQDEGSDTLGCPPVREIAAGLARKPNDTAGRLCLAEYMRLNGFDYMPIDSAPPKDELGGTRPLFPGPPYSRLEVYKRIIADPKASADDKAYALYRAVNCYAPTGSNSCSGVDVPVDQRRAWFDRLRKEFPASPWAKELKYYW